MSAPEKRTPAGGPGRVGKASCGWEVYQNSAIDQLLGRLERVKQTGPGQWMARCPGHQDKSPSLSVKQCDDGTILLHDFGGCSPLDILAAVGLTLAALFPRRLTPQTPTQRREAREAFNRKAWCAALRVVCREASVVCAAASVIRNREPMPADFDERLGHAIRALDGAREVLANGH